MVAQKSRLLLLKNQLKMLDYGLICMVDHLKQVYTEMVESQGTGDGINEELVDRMEDAMTQEIKGM